VLAAFVHPDSVSISLFIRYLFLRYARVASHAEDRQQKIVWRTNGEYGSLAVVDEGRKRVLGIMAAILAARKLSQFEGNARVSATICAIADAIRWAEEIMRRIDERWPTRRPR